MTDDEIDVVAVLKNSIEHGNYIMPVELQMAILKKLLSQRDAMQFSVEIIGHLSNGFPKVR